MLGLVSSPEQLQLGLCSLRPLPVLMFWDPKKVRVLDLRKSVSEETLLPTIQAAVLGGFAMEQSITLETRK